MIYTLKWKLFQWKRFKSTSCDNYSLMMRWYQEKKDLCKLFNGGFVQLYQETEKHPILAEMVGGQAVT